MVLRVGFQVLTEDFHDRSIISISDTKCKSMFFLNIAKSFWKCHVKPGQFRSKWEVVTKSAEYSKYEELVTIVQKYEEVMTKSAWYHVSISYIPTSGNWQNIAPLAFLAKSMFMFTLFLAFDPTIFIFHRSKHYIRHQKFVILTRIAGIPLLLIKPVVLAGLKTKSIFLVLPCSIPNLTDKLAAFA